MTPIRKMALVPYTFVLMNVAAVIGLYNFVRGRFDIWKTPGGKEIISS